jgi:hypothetical protein
MVGQVEERVHLRDRHALGAFGDSDDLVAGAALALLAHAQVEAGPAMRHEQRGHPGLVHADADPVAGDARLRHLEERSADAMLVANTHLVVGQAIDREVLAELPKSEAAPPSVASQ